MVDNADLIEQYADKLQIMLTQMHKDGISDEVIGFVVQQTINNFNLVSYCRQWFEEIVE